MLFLCSVGVILVVHGCYCLNSLVPVIIHSLDSKLGKLIGLLNHLQLQQPFLPISITLKLCLSISTKSGAGIMFEQNQVECD